ncbi:hypothetical protein [Blastococcus capsensis]|uniref:hypothetical protein n=1 Tax=Blastococcus capsensis TaxID=1564163 RepID=UPI00253FB5F6|nr:hypothetical protein [Blastococcus capsensis]MDK3256457.1 hypothetical protein [Blastococcus capsensis]
MPTLTIAQNARADELLSRDPLALLIGMLLDQHMRRRRAERWQRQLLTSAAR